MLPTHATHPRIHGIRTPTKPRDIFSKAFPKRFSALRVDVAYLTIALRVVLAYLSVVCCTDTSDTTLLLPTTQLVTRGIAATLKFPDIAPAAAPERPDFEIIVCLDRSQWALSIYRSSNHYYI